MWPLHCQEKQVQARRERAHPEGWWASFSGLGGPLAATHEYGAQRSRAKIYTLVTSMREGGRRWPVSKETLSDLGELSPHGCAIAFSITKSSLSAWSQASRWTAAGQLLAGGKPASKSHDVEERSSSKRGPSPDPTPAPSQESAAYTEEYWVPSGKLISTSRLCCILFSSSS